MRKLILQLAITADGYIEGPHGEYDWCFTDPGEDYGMAVFLENIDTLLMGRKTYEVMMAADEAYFTDKQWVVVSKTLKEIPQGPVVHSDIVEYVKQLKSLTGKDIWLFGGAELSKLMIENNLIDRIELAVHPILLGSGKLLFSDLSQRKPLRFIESVSYESGLVMMKYEPVIN